MGILNILMIWTWINSMDPSVSTKATSISAPKLDRRCSEKNGRSIYIYIYIYIYTYIYIYQWYLYQLWYEYIWLYIWLYMYMQIIFLDFLHQKYTASHESPTFSYPFFHPFPSLGVPRPSFWPRRSSSWPWPDAWQIRSAASRHRRARVEPSVATEAGLFCSNWV